jgi:hypothetical protein
MPLRQLGYKFGPWDQAEAANVAPASMPWEIPANKASGDMMLRLPWSAYDGMRIKLRQSKGASAIRSRSARRYRLSERGHQEPR